MTPDFDSKKVINDEQGTGHKDMYRNVRAQPMPDFTAVKVSSGTTCMHMPVTCLTSRQWV